MTAYFFDEPPAALDRDTLYVALPDGPYPLALGQIERVEVKRADNKKNFNIALSALFLGIIVAITLSDPDAWDMGY